MKSMQRHRDPRRYPPYRHGLITLLTAERRLEACAAHVARFIREHASDGVVIYGCGKLSKKLATGFPEAFAGRRTLFCTTDRGTADRFWGFEKLAVADLVDAAKDTIILASATYDGAMRSELEKIGLTQALSLVEVLDRMVSLEELEALAEMVRQGFGDDIRRLEALAANGRPTLCAFIDNFGPFHNPNSLAALRELGWNLAFCTRSPRPTAPQEGLYDLLTCQDTPCDAFLFFELLAGTPIPGLILEYYSTGIPDQFLPLVPAVLQTRRNPVSLLIDAHPSQLLDNRQVQERCRRQLGLSVQEILARYSETLHNMDAILHKDSCEMLTRLAGRPLSAPVLKHMPPIIDSSRNNDPVTPLAACEPPRIVFGTSLAHNKEADWAYPPETLLPMIESLTDQGLHFTLYNVADNEGGLFLDLEALAAANPLFEYRTAVAPLVFAEELKKYHFGWLANDMACRDGAFPRSNLQLKVFFYAQAKLPIIVSPSFRRCAEFVCNNGIGIAMSREQWHDAKTLLDSFDRKAYEARVEAFKARMDYHAICASLSLFYSQFVGPIVPAGT